MSETEHTLGPWRASPQSTFVENGKPHGVVCHLAATNMVANARLIAAAPDLLAALDEAIAIITDNGRIVFDDVHGKAVTRMRAAIDKATAP